MQMLGCDNVKTWKDDDDRVSQKMKWEETLVTKDVGWKEEK